MRNILITTIAFLLSIAAFSQEALWGGQNIISPEIHKDNTITFRLLAPKADSVQVVADFVFVKAGNKETIDGAGIKNMTKNADGLWEYTTPLPVASDLYNYRFLVDGVAIADPNNVYLVRDVSTIANLFVVGGGQGDYYKVKNVAHGSVTRRWYHSPTLGMERRITVYTPAGYENSNETYPVFYLLHGMGGDEEAWAALGRATQILDNLIAEGKAKPMILVMTNGNAIQEAAPGESSLGFYKPEFFLPNTMDGLFESSFPDVVNFIDNNYRTIKSKSGRAIAGLSMGGFHSIHISKEYPDMFDYVGVFSGAILPSEKNAGAVVYADIDAKLKIQFDKNPQLYWIAIGKTDFLYKDNVTYRQRLDKANHKYIYHETEGGHTWRNWRNYLTVFTPMLFK